MSLSRSYQKTNGNRYWKVTTEPAVEPITVEELKMFARIDGAYEDTFLQSIIVSIRQATEQYLGRALITQTYTMTMDYWPSYVIKFPRAPLISVESIAVVAEDGTETEYDSDNYYLNLIAQPGQLIIKDSSTIPTIVDRDYAAYKIIFKAGYGTIRTDVPEAIREGIKTWATFIYENRLPIANPPFGAHSLFQPYKIIRI